MPVSTTRRGLSAISALLLIVTMLLTSLPGAAPAIAAPPEAPQAAPGANPSLTDLFRSAEPDIFGALLLPATTTPGICSNDKNIACATDADCAGNTCYLPTGGGGALLQNQVCMDDANPKDKLQCTANDVSLAATHDLVITDPCEFPGDTASISFVAEFLLTAEDRYDIGVWISQDGGNALTGTCAVADFPIAPTPPWTNLDAAAQPADTCGDITASNNPVFSSIQNITIECVDHDGNGQADVNSCLSWRQSGANDVCTSPLQAFPGSPSKCKCQSLPGIDILIPGRIIVDKVTHPSGSPQSFDFTLTGGPDNINRSFSLTDQQTPYNSGGLKLGTYAVSESVPLFWLQTGATCTSDQPGRAPTPSNIVLHNGETVTCTFTNEVSTKVNLRSFTATGGPRSVDLNWVTASEVNNLGFNLYRATKIDGRRTQLNAQIIPPTNQPPGSSQGSAYAYRDTTVKPKTTYYYWLESVDLSGATQLFEPVSAQPTK